MRNDACQMFFEFENIFVKFLIKFDIIKSIFNIFFDCLFVIVSSFCQIFIFLILQRNLLFVIEYKYISYWLNSNDFSFKLFTMLCVSFVVEFLSFNILLKFKLILFNY